MHVRIVNSEDPDLTVYGEAVWSDHGSALVYLGLFDKQVLLENLDHLQGKNDFKAK